ncbi:hypothetical protein AX760_25210 [Pararhizobium antarcticum]|uniref:Uncharacterized protein n=1 Tax=Pararhizobium antarcticum TaxID=1798805 RepID=A0A657LYR8_9HYPH|nr:hypothetical protein AX760_25210 [Pararhizobium antarcticum]
MPEAGIDVEQPVVAKANVAATASALKVAIVFLIPRHSVYIFNLETKLKDIEYLNRPPLVQAGRLFRANRLSIFLSHA